MKVKMQKADTTTLLSKEDINKAKSAMGSSDVGLKVIPQNNDEKINEDKQNDNGTSISLKVKESTQPASEIKMNVENSDDIGIKVVESDKFSERDIFIKMREIQQQRQEELEDERDYSHYEDEYAYLMEDEFDYPSKGGRKHNWK